jgi:hypothetical protein
MSDASPAPVSLPVAGLDVALMLNPVALFDAPPIAVTVGDAAVCKLIKIK